MFQTTSQIIYYNLLTSIVDSIVEYCPEKMQFDQMQFDLRYPSVA